MYQALRFHVMNIKREGKQSGGTRVHYPARPPGVTTSKNSPNSALYYVGGKQHVFDHCFTVDYSFLPPVATYLDCCTAPCSTIAYSTNFSNTSSHSLVDG